MASHTRGTTMPNATAPTQNHGASSPSTRLRAISAPSGDADALPITYAVRVPVSRRAIAMAPIETAR